MTTVKEAISLVSQAAESVTLAYAGNQVSGFNWKDPIAVEAYGNFVIEGIYAISENSLELNIAIQPIVKVGGKCD